VGVLHRDVDPGERGRGGPGAELGVGGQDVEVEVADEARLVVGRGIGDVLDLQQARPWWAASSTRAAIPYSDLVVSESIVS